MSSLQGRGQIERTRATLPNVQGGAKWLLACPKSAEKLLTLPRVSALVSVLVLNRDVTNLGGAPETIPATIAAEVARG